MTNVERVMGVVRNQLRETYKKVIKVSWVSPKSDCLPMLDIWEWRGCEGLTRTD